ncbi:MAG TPA: hypothetical protein VM283_01845, partial [Armatimonadota bacterium]|nr:hypothetical protein [Armatimonadota bacterium]
ERTGADALARIAELSGLGVSRVLLDTRTEAGVGGSGVCCDWETAAEIVREAELPVMLAGGLSPENLREAIAATSPAAVDLSSSLESAPGCKHPARLRELGRVWREIAGE